MGLYRRVNWLETESCGRKGSNWSPLQAQGRWSEHKNRPRLFHARCHRNRLHYYCIDNPKLIRLEWCVLTSDVELLACLLACIVFPRPISSARRARPPCCNTNLKHQNTFLTHLSHNNVSGYFKRNYLTPSLWNGMSFDSRCAGISSYRSTLHEEQETVSKRG